MACPLYTKAAPWLTACNGWLNMPPEVLAASTGLGGLLTSRHEGLPRGLEHHSTSFLQQVPSESFNLRKTGKDGALLFFLLGEGCLTAGEVSQQCLLVFQWIGFLKRLQVYAFSLVQCFCDSCMLNARIVHGTPWGTSPVGLGTLPCSGSP